MDHLRLSRKRKEKKSTYPYLVRLSGSVKKEKSDLVGCSQLEVEIGSSGVEMTIK